jgi:uncharacterized damage-inducible protein DinB
MPTITEAAEMLVRATVDLPDEEMDRTWVWNEYDEEGLRFALLLAQHELRDLAVRLAAKRSSPPTQAERILAQYHHAYRDLTGALAGLQDEDLDRAPAEGEWPVRDVVEHMVGADYGFLAVIQYARSPERPRDAAAAEAEWKSFRDRHDYRAPEAIPGDLATVRAVLFEIHRRVLRELADLRDADLEVPAYFWDGVKPIRFRLHRFEAHYVQHTIQVDKTREALGRAPTEAQRLVRVLYRDLAAVEMTPPAVGQAERDAVATVIRDRAGEIASLVDVVPHGASS